MVMAKATITKWIPGQYNTSNDSPGAIKLLNMYSHLGQKDAKIIIDKIKAGHHQTVDVSFTKLDEFKKLMELQGYRVI